MTLHQDQELFKDLIDATALHLKLPYLYIFNRGVKIGSFS